VFLFGIEELGIQIEEPFGVLPLEALCDTSIEGVVMDMRDSYVQGHFGPLAEPVAGVVRPLDSAWSDLEPGATGAPLQTPSEASFSSGDYLSQTIRR
jgi:hypothetical protein